MKKAKALAEEKFTSSTEMQNTSKNLRRIVTSISSVADRDVGWTVKEKKVLTEAAALLGQLANEHAEAARIKQKNDAKRADRQAAIRAAMRDSFVKLRSIPDQVALVAAVLSYRTKAGFGIDDLENEVKEAIDSLAYRLARNAPFSDMTPAAAVAAAWSRFNDSAAQLRTDCAALIERLETERNRRTQPPTAQPIV